MIVGLELLLAAVLALSRTDADELVPASWTLGTAAVRTRGAHDHEWITGPRGGVFYWTDRGTKVYRRR